MPWRDAQALHIFAPNTSLYGLNWVEQILGSILLPLCNEFKDQIRWIWVTRYSGQYDKNNPPVQHSLDPDFLLAGAYYRFVVFRLSIHKEAKHHVQTRGVELAKNAGCYVQNWLDYDIVGDLGNNRFIAPSANDEQRARRANLIVNFIDSTIRLMLDSLSQNESGLWSLEENISDQNPNSSFFESIHHLFSNSTGVPTEVFVERDGDTFGLHTAWMGGFSIFKMDDNFPKRLRINY